MDEPRVPVTFTLPELELLREFVRHEMVQQDTWRHPPVDMDLNEQIALAICACVDGNLLDYTLHLTHHQCLVIDFVIRRDVQIPGATGRDIVLKVCRARWHLQYGPLSAEPAGGMRRSQVVEKLRDESWQRRKGKRGG